MKNKLFLKKRFFSLIVCLFFAAGTSLLYAQTKSKNAKTYSTQTLRWSADPNVLEYRIEIQDISGNIIQTVTTENNSLEISLPNGKYKYKITAYDLLGRESVNSGWNQLEVLKASQPAISMEQTLESLEEDGKTLELDVEIKDVTTGSKVELVNPETGETIAGNLLIDSAIDADASEVLHASKSIFENVPEGKWQLVVTNPSGLFSESEPFEVQDTMKEKRLAAEKSEKERLERERLEAERIEQERLAAEQERLERERLEAERIEQERLAAEQERLERERLEAERIEQERLAADQERLERERLEAERIEQERLAEELAEQERIAAELAAREKLENDVAANPNVPVNGLKYSDDIISMASQIFEEEEMNDDYYDDLEIPDDEEIEAQRKAERHEKWLNYDRKFYVNAGVGANFCLYDNDFISKYFMNGFTPSFTARIDFLPIHKNKWRFGLEIAGSRTCYTYSNVYYDLKLDMNMLQTNLIYRFSFAKNKLWLSVKGGGGISLMQTNLIFKVETSEKHNISENFAYFMAGGGLSLTIVPKQLIIFEIGADYTNIFMNDVSTGLISPYITAGIRF